MTDNEVVVLIFVPSETRDTGNVVDNEFAAPNGAGICAKHFSAPRDDTVRELRKRSKKRVIAISREHIHSRISHVEAPSETSLP